MIPVTKTYLPDYEIYSSYLAKIWESGQITNNGDCSQNLHEALQTHLGISNLTLVANGTLALQLAIKALGLTGEIITTPYSYVATTNAILWEGCKPIFVDVDPDSFCINPKLIEAAITEHTSAILATHVYGYPCDVHEIQKIADRHNIKVIYDAAHAFGVRLNNKSLLSHGDCSTLSFHATKLFHTVEGGAIICRDEDVLQRTFLMSKFGHIGEDEYLDVGINAKMSEFHAAMGLAILPVVQDIIAARKQRSEWYNKYLSHPSVRYPQSPPGLEYNYAYYPVIFDTHSQMMRVRKALQEHDIMPRRYFYPSLNTLPFLHHDLQLSCPVSEDLAMCVLCLPLYISLPQDVVKEISILVAENTI